MPWYKQMWQRIKASGWSEPNSYFIYFKSDAGDQGRFIQNWNSSYHLYGGKSDWLVNLGYADQGQTYVTVTFSEPGLYTFDSLDVVCQPMGSFDERVDALKASTVDDLEFGVNEITGTIALDERKAVFFSVAYSDGWSATVDGEPAQIYRANTGFMALDVDEGFHDIRLTYWTPGLTLGLCSTLVGAAMVVVLIVFYRLRAFRRGIEKR